MEGLVGSQEFGRARYLAAGKERPHISKSKLLANDNVEFVKLGEHSQVAYRDWEGRRYIAAEALTYDFLVTFYDVNSSRGFAARMFGEKELHRVLGLGLGSVMSPRPNIEVRMMGLQNGQDHGFLKAALSFVSKKGIRLIEADLFGEDIRHVAVDLKTGASYNILLEDRSYRPGELINRMTIEDFQRSLMPAPKT
jgi:hypothetical protein